jgi:4-carboxymuconolactone decarboxylase
VSTLDGSPTCRRIHDNLEGMTDVREQGLQVFRELLPGAAPANMRDGKFGDELLEIGIDNVFGRLWAREGLSRRDRSLVTLGILIALRATDELTFHVQIARNNGLTEDEIAEVIYHASGYAGFPAANTACKIAREVFDETS